MSTTPQIPFSIDSTLGVAFVGNLLAAILYGVTNVQTYVYFTRSWGDSWALKLVVLFLWAVDGFHLGTISHAMYFYTVTSFNDPDSLMKPSWCIMAAIAATAVNDATVRALYMYRIWKLGRKFLIIAVIALVSAAVFAASLVFIVRCERLGDFRAFLEISWVPYVGYAGTVISDLIIAVAMCLALRDRRTGLKSTETLVNKLMMYSINTGALTSVCAIVCLIVYATMPHNFIFLAFYFVLPKLSLNSLLATLNARGALKASVHRQAVVSLPTSQRPLRSWTKSPLFSSIQTEDQAPSLEVSVETVTEKAIEQTTVQDEVWMARLPPTDDSHMFKAI